MNTKARPAAKQICKYPIIFIGIFLYTTLFLQNITFAEILYVSKTGTSTPPYTTWETASDSIQKAVNICNDGDTVIVANGVYKECLLINTNICLIGSSMDSTIIDARGIVNPEAGSDSLTTVLVYAKFEMKNFSIIGNHGIIVYMRGDLYGMILTNMKLENGVLAVAFYNGYNKAENLIIRNTKSGFFSGDFFNTSTYDVNNNIIVIDERFGNGYSQSGYGTLSITNNIILHINPDVVTESGIFLRSPGRTVIKNNLIAGFRSMQYSEDFVNAIDTIFILNNVIGYTLTGSIFMVMGEKRVLRNNIFINAKEGVEVFHSPELNPDYNLYWNIDRKYIRHVVGGENEIEADPMVVKDTLPNAEIDMNMHLQAYSPAIDKGDPAILDSDGSRSDIGMYGGPLGQNYTYIDLAPRNPQNVIAVFDNGLFNLKWNKNSEADLFRYRIYRDTVPGFIYDTTKIIAVTADTFYNDNTSNFMAGSYYYKVTAIDSAYNQSPASEEIRIIVTGLGEMPPQVIEDYKLMQNYPNPFNPSTKITYRLKEPGHVKLMVYNILGEIVKVLVNEYQEKGYYEAEFTSESEYLESTKGILKDSPTFYGDKASGIYLYRIEVTGKGSLPVYMDMKKMMLVK